MVVYMAPDNLGVCTLLCTCLLLITDTFGVSEVSDTATSNGTVTNLRTNSIVNGSIMVRTTEEHSTNSTPKFKPNWLIYGKKINSKRSIKTANHIKCWEKCESKKKCKFITWITKNKICILFSSYKGGKAKKDYISGPFPTTSSAPPSPAPLIGTYGNESLILNSRITQETSSCPGGWTSLATGCYRFLPDSGYAETFEEAKSSCAIEGGYLVEINSQEEQNALVQFSKDNGRNGDWWAWLGATDRSKEGEWIWIHSGQKMTFNAWHRGEPNNGGNNEDCLVAWHGFEWFDISCDHTYTGRKALCEHPVVNCLTSPGYPNNYPNHYRKRHDFSVTGQAMEITFQDFNVENQNTCSYDKLWVYNGYGVPLTSPHGLCGYSLPPKFTIPTSSAIVIFITDGSVTKKGFRLCYKAVDNCVTSPGYPNNYNNNDDHRHSFSLATRQPMEVTFHSFDVEAHRTCSYDRLEISDGNGHLVKSLCGSSLPPKFTIPTSSAAIRFISDHSVTKKGFKLCYNAACGQENSGSRISGGSVTRANQYPWMVRLAIKESDGKTYGCGGSLITDRHVLTAKHCVDDRDSTTKVIIGESRVKVSVHDQYDPSDYQEVTIREFMFPDTSRWQNYVKPGKDDHDIAIIILATSVDFKDNTIGTVCLPSSDDEDYRGKEVMAMGWGWTPDTSSQSQFLQHLKLTVAQRQAKYWLWTEVVFQNGIPLDVCRGDSGGPLVYKKEGKWTVIGTVQGGAWCDSHTGQDGRWNKVTDHLIWINNVMVYT